MTTEKSSDGFSGQVLLQRRTVRSGADFSPHMLALLRSKFLVNRPSLVIQ